MSEQMPLVLGAELYGRAFGQLDGPVHWPSLTTPERAARTVELRHWTEEFVARFDMGAAPLEYVPSGVMAAG